MSGSSVRRIFKRGGRNFRKFEIKEDQNKNFPAHNQVRVPAQTEVKTKKKGLHSNLVQILAKKRSSPTVSVLKPAQVTKGGGGGTMPHFCILFYANYPGNPKGGHGPMAPLNTPLVSGPKSEILCGDTKTESYQQQLGEDKKKRSSQDLA